MFIDTESEMNEINEQLHLKNDDKPLTSSAFLLMFCVAHHAVSGEFPVDLLEHMHEALESDGYSI